MRHVAECGNAIVSSSSEVDVGAWERRVDVCKCCRLEVVAVAFVGEATILPMTEHTPEAAH